MILHAFLIFSFIKFSEAAVQCYVTNGGNYSKNQWTEEKVSCPNTNVCFTIIDYGYDTIEKQCGAPYLNCTYNGITLPRICDNSSVSLASCCCYGELCNRSTTIQFPFLLFFVFICSVSIVTL